MKETIVRNQEGMQVKVMSSIQTVKLTGKETGGQYSLNLSEIPAGGGVPTHVHTREDEIFEITQGQVEVVVDKNSYLLQEGDTIYLPKNIPHSFKAVTDVKMKVVTIPAGIEDMFLELSRLPAGPPDIEKVHKICHQYGVEFL